MDFSFDATVDHDINNDKYAMILIAIKHLTSASSIVLFGIDRKFVIDLLNIPSSSIENKFRDSHAIRGPFQTIVHKLIPGTMTSAASMTLPNYLADKIAELATTFMDLHKIDMPDISQN